MRAIRKSYSNNARRGISGLQKNYQENLLERRSKEKMTNRGRNPFEFALQVLQEIESDCFYLLTHVGRPLKKRLSRRFNSLAENFLADIGDNK